jgi:hypothetical protein
MIIRKRNKNASAGNGAYAQKGTILRVMVAIRTKVSPGNYRFE